MIGAPPPRAGRLIRLTPLIDVIFILLIFFMLASSLENEGHIPLGIAEPGAPSDDPRERIRVELWPEAVKINGEAIGPGGLAPAVQRHLQATPGRAVTIRSHAGVSLQRLLRTAADLRAAGINELALVPPVAP